MFWSALLCHCFCLSVPLGAYLKFWALYVKFLLVLVFSMEKVLVPWMEKVLVCAVFDTKLNADSLLQLV